MTAESIIGILVLAFALSWTLNRLSKLAYVRLGFERSRYGLLELEGILD